MGFLKKLEAPINKKLEKTLNKIADVPERVCKVIWQGIREGLFLCVYY